jgi:hypothetical protein
VLDAERSDVAEDGEKVGNQDVGGENADEIVGDESPNRKLGALSDGSSGEQRKDE